VYTLVSGKERTIRFQWEKVKNAILYKLEISADRDFTEILTRIKSDKTHGQWRTPGKGVYYCRIYSIDKDKFSGPFSETVGFFADVDVTPPYLAVYSPEDGEISLSNDIQVRGSVEKDATITIDGSRRISTKTGSSAIR